MTIINDKIVFEKGDFAGMSQFRMNALLAFIASKKFAPGLFLPIPKIRNKQSVEECLAFALNGQLDIVDSLFKDTKAQDLNLKELTDAISTAPDEKVAFVAPLIQQIKDILK